jgi:hypothetical protein
MHAIAKTSTYGLSNSKDPRSGIRITKSTILAVTTALITAILSGVIVVRPANAGTHRALAASPAVYPIGIVDPTEPSGMAPSGGSALPGYRLSYSNDFNGTAAPPGWELFSGIPGGDPGGQFAISHVVFSGGLMRVSTWQDPLYQNRWVTGGLCQCKVARVYGAYFVRTRVTGPSPNVAELLWPVTNRWPPEIDFNENGGSTQHTTSTVHWAASNSMAHRSLNIVMTQWHTWGVIWTPSSVIYTVDGRQWAAVTVPSEIPTVRMDLNFELRTMCALGRECPTSPQSLLVDWATEYVAVNH